MPTGNSIAQRRGEPRKRRSRKANVEQPPLPLETAPPTLDADRDRAHLEAALREPDKPTTPAAARSPMDEGEPPAPDRSTREGSSIEATSSPPRPTQSILAEEAIPTRFCTVEAAMAFLFDQRPAPLGLPYRWRWQHPEQVPQVHTAEAVYERMKNVLRLKPEHRTLGWLYQWVFEKPHPLDPARRLRWRPEALALLISFGLWLILVVTFNTLAMLNLYP